MLESRSGTVQSVQLLDSVTALLDVSAGGQMRPTIAYLPLCGEITEGDEVLINTTATMLGLGTGGYDFVIANLSRKSGVFAPGQGHIIKLRYTPLQHAVLSEEEQRPDEPEGGFPDLDGMPVVAAPLHSHLAPVAAAIKAEAPRARVLYIMTDGAALPLAVSNLVRTLLDQRLIDATMTCGQAFGGQYEAINLYSALHAARTRCGADIAVVCQGPGNVGTATALGFSAVETGTVINASGVLGGRPVACVRMSQADPRPRHRLISHHTLTVLSRIALTASTVALPVLEDALRDEAHKQLADLKLFEKHEIRTFEAAGGVKLLQERGIEMKSMGRGYADDPVFFQAASAAGKCAADMLKDTYWG